MRRKLININKQERVVTALWNFAADMQQRPKEGTVATTLSKPKVKVSLKHVGTALDDIMDAFGYGVAEIQ